jgi:16S rRNA A1518/A1519 N6-dimethyltransferase RsmA/KsgA/DIM1 with predicted DNA glycosylase/AP lyase activity
MEFDFNAVIKCEKTDFHPVPNVDIVVLEIKRRTPLFELLEKRVEYIDFLAYCFNKSVPIVSKAFPTLKYNPLGQKVISDFETSELLDLFEQTKAFVNTYRGYAQKLRYEQMTVKKVFRTRNAKDWKSKRYSGK